MNNMKISKSIQKMWTNNKDRSKKFNFKIELFMTIPDSYKLLNVIKSSLILDVAGFLDFRIS